MATLHCDFNQHSCIELYRDRKFVRFIPMESAGLIINRMSIDKFDHMYSPMEYKGGVKHAAKIYLNSTIKIAFRAAAALKQAHFTGKVDRTKLKGIANTFTNEVVITPTTKKSRTSALKKDCGDNIASKLRGMDLVEVYTFVADKLGDSIGALKTKYNHLNPGMQRMCLGNRLRK